MAGQEDILVRNAFLYDPEETSDIAVADGQIRRIAAE